VNWCYLGSVGAFGGILLMWDRRVMEKSEEFGGGAYSVACSFRNVDDYFEWAFISVYDSNANSDRSALGCTGFGCLVECSMVYQG